MLETAWESRWLPDYKKSDRDWIYGKFRVCNGYQIARKVKVLRLRNYFENFYSVTC